MGCANPRLAGSGLWRRDRHRGRDGMARDTQDDNGHALVPLIVAGIPAALIALMASRV